MFISIPVVRLKAVFLSPCRSPHLIELLNSRVEIILVENTRSKQLRAVNQALSKCAHECTRFTALGELPPDVQVNDLHSTRIGGSSLPRSKRCGFLIECPANATKFDCKMNSCYPQKKRRAASSNSRPTCVLLIEPIRWKLFSMRFRCHSYCQFGCEQNGKSKLPIQPWPPFFKLQA
jgi:hypothetical protein